MFSPIFVVKMWSESLCFSVNEVWQRESSLNFQIFQCRVRTSIGEPWARLCLVRRHYNLWKLLCGVHLIHLLYISHVTQKLPIISSSQNVYTLFVTRNRHYRNTKYLHCCRQQYLRRELFSPYCVKCKVSTGNISSDHFSFSTVLMAARDMLMLMLRGQ